jgi:hypothetical protein
MLPYATTAALLLFGRGDAVIELAGVALLKIGAAYRRSARHRR